MAIANRPDPTRRDHFSCGDLYRRSHHWDSRFRIRTGRGGRLALHTHSAADSYIDHWFWSGGAGGFCLEAPSSTAVGSSLALLGRRCVRRPGRHRHSQVGAPSSCTRCRRRTAGPLQLLQSCSASDKSHQESWSCCRRRRRRSEWNSGRSDWSRGYPHDDMVRHSRLVQGRTTRSLSTGWGRNVRDERGMVWDQWDYFSGHSLAFRYWTSRSGDRNLDGLATLRTSERSKLS